MNVVKKNNDRVRTKQLAFVVFVLDLFVLCCFCEVGFGQQFQVDGKVDFKTYGSNGNLAQNHSYAYSLCVSNQNWEMEITPTNKSGLDYARFAYDGTQLYVYENMETLMSKSLKAMQASGQQIPPANELNLGEAWVVNSEIPRDSAIDGSGQIWLSFASAFYFKSIVTNMLEVPWVFGARKLPIAADEYIFRRALWTVQQDTPQLPEKIDYLSEAGDFTNGQYRVNTYTNFEGMKLPLESSLKVFIRDKKTARIYLLYCYTVNATSFKHLNKSFVFPPSVPVLTAVSDDRFKNLTTPFPQAAVSYFVTNRLLTKEEARQTPYFNIAKIYNNKTDVEIRSAGGRWVVLAIMVGSSIIILAIIIRSGFRNKHKTDKET